MKHTRLSPEDFPSALRCSVCSYQWMPRKKNKKPTVCPNCYSRRWWWPKDAVSFFDTNKIARATAARATAAKKAS